MLVVLCRLVGNCFMQVLHPVGVGLQMCPVSPEAPAKPEAWQVLSDEHPWLVVKPDQLLKRREKHGQVYMNRTFEEVRKWMEERMHHHGGLYPWFLLILIEGSSAVSYSKPFNSRSSG